MGMPPLPTPMPTGEFREGVGFKAGDMQKWLKTGGLQWIMLEGRIKSSKGEQKEGYYIMSDVQQAYDEATEQIDKAKVAYHKTLESFRSTIKNDMASIAASAAKVQAEAQKMNQAYGTAIANLTSEKMEAAIANAERLAAALTAISAVNSHSLTLEVTDKTAVIQKSADG